MRWRDTIGGAGAEMSKTAADILSDAVERISDVFRHSEQWHVLWSPDSGWRIVSDVYVKMAKDRSTALRNHKI